MIPQSCATVTFLTATLPVERSTSTSAICATTVPAMPESATPRPAALFRPRVAADRVRSAPRGRGCHPALVAAAAERDAVVIGLDAGLPRREHRRQARVGPRERVLDVVPRRDGALRVEPGSNRDQLWRTLWLPSMLVLAHPLHTHRPADCLRHQRRILRRVVRLEAAEAARALAIGEMHVLLAEAKQPRDAVPRDEGRLRTGPDRRLAALDVGDRARRADHPVHLERPPVRRVERLRRPAERRGYVAGVGPH